VKVKAVYAGTFDPVTYGHIDLIKRSAKIFDRLILAVAESRGKNTFFNTEERVEMLQKSVEGLKNVEVDSFNGLLVDYLKERRAGVVLRGLRAVSDFEYELQMVLTNRKLAPEIETVFMMPREEYSYISSSILKEIFSMGADVRQFVPPFVKKQLLRKLKEKNENNY
jgi:pantetheine-phosphate adenylyltransferase